MDQLKQSLAPDHVAGNGADRSRAAAPRWNVYAYQQQIMPLLLGWAVGSMAAGMYWWRCRFAWVRGLGSQFVGWGAIDGLIALFGRHGAVRNAARYAAGEIDAAEHARQARQFEIILWVNTGLDVVYMLSGRWLVARYRVDRDHSAPDDTHPDAARAAERRGMGWGIIVQGAFLFWFDLVNALIVRRQRKDAAQ